MLRRGGTDENEDEEPLLESEKSNQNDAGEDDESSDGNDLLSVDEDQLLEDFRNLYWTRLMSTDTLDLDQERKWPIGPDAVEECQAVADVPPDDCDDWSPLFDPHKFNAEYGPLEIENYRLPPEDLQIWAERCVKLRATIAGKARQ